MSALSSEATIDEHLSEQLINCINVQTNVIQNLTQYSQHISLQLIEIKNNVNILTNRILTLEEQQLFTQIYPPPINPLLVFQPTFQISPSIPKQQQSPPPFSFSTAPTEQPSRNAPFVFGPITSNNTTHLDEDDDDDDPEVSPIIPFERIVHLQPVDTKTGEEDENILFCERAKLYRFDPSTNQMKERGTGEMKILQHKTNNACRVLMRREHVLKVCANHKLTTHMKLKPHQGTPNAFIWSAIDYADGEAKHETLCVRFKTEDQAKQFEKIFNQSKGSTSSLPSIERISLNDDDVIPLGEIKPTPEQIERARKLQLPLTFYLYENKEPCKGCRGCRDDLSLNEILFGSPGNFPNSPVPSLMSMVPTMSFLNQMSSPPKDYRMIVKAKRSLPSNRPPPPPSYEPISPEINRTEETTVANAHQKKSRNFSGQKTETRSLEDYSSKMAQTILNEVKQELDKQIEIVKTEEDNNKPSKSSNTGFSFANFDTKPSGFHFSTETTFSFGNTPKLSFSDLVKQSSDENSTPDETEERVFPGQGSMLFGANTTEESDESTFAFKPIVKLLPVETKTGEEDEDILFCERAKLYRFDSSTNEMKERGIGEMKILQHKTTKICRILMRQEQVFKVRANHKITSKLELKPHQGSDRAYVWSAMDFTDGAGGKHETFCVKFKTSDIAKRFFQQFNEVKIEQ